MKTSADTHAAEKSPNLELANKLRLGLAAAQTAYELNNGHGIRTGQQLKLIEDAATASLPGARPLNLPIPDGYIVKGIFHDPEKGLNAYLAFNASKKEVVIGIAGTNGFGNDWADTKDDMLSLGVEQAKALATNDAFKSALRTIVSEPGISKGSIEFLITGQSLGGGIAPTLGMFIAYGNPSLTSDTFFNSLGIAPEQITVVSTNGFGNEYSATIAGFSADKVQEFSERASLNRLVVHNRITGNFDYVSQLGGTFSGTDWLLEVESARGLAELHRIGNGGAEGTDLIGGDFTKLQSGDVPVINHRTLSDNAALISRIIPVANNPASVTLAGYTALLFSKPGEGAAALSAGLQSLVGLPAPIADVVGVIGEFVLRALPIARAAQAMQFLLASYVGTQLIGSRDSPLPPFDVVGQFGPVQEGWVRREIVSKGSVVPVAVIDTNPRTLVSVIKQFDGRSIETHPDGTQIQTDPDLGIAVTGADGSGLLFLKSIDETSGEWMTSTVRIEAGTRLSFDERGWMTQRLLDPTTNLYEEIRYDGLQAEIRETQLVTAPDGKARSVPITRPLQIDLPATPLSLPDVPLLRESTVVIGPDHVRIVTRDDDRRTVQTVDIVTTRNSSESTTRDGQGNVLKIIRQERLNADAMRTTTIDSDGKTQDITVVQRYRRNGELLEMEDHTDTEAGSRFITVRDSEGNIRKSGSVALEGTPSEFYQEAVLDDLYSDVADFLTALRQKDTAGILLSTARIALDYARSQGTATLPFDTAVADVSSGLALVSSLRALQSGDALAKVGGTVGLINAANYFAARMTGSGFLTATQTAALSQVNAALAIVNLKNLAKMIEAGQLGSAGATLVTAINAGAYLAGASSALMGSGALIAVNPLVMAGVAILADVMFGDDAPPPPPLGSARFYREADGRLAYQITESNKLGEKILHRELTELTSALDQRLRAVNEHTSDPQHRLTLIASRMPDIQIASWPSYTGNGADNYFFVLKQQDPMRDDPGYLGLSRKDLTKLYGETLLLPEAIVQQWEVDHLQKKFGNDETHWQTEGEWLRGRSPIERTRSQLQQAVDLARTRWEAIAKLSLSLSLTSGGAARSGSNVSLQGTANKETGPTQQALTAAEVALDTFNQQHPIDPQQAARATAEQEAAFAQAHGVRSAVTLQWMKPIVVDLGNDGVNIVDLPGQIGTDLNSLRTQRVARFDVDGDGFREATQWISPADAILGIDRSGNGILDSGSELFNGADTPFDQHGIASLAFYDANGDGLITRDDPVYQQLRLWIDMDGDGSTGALEVFDLQMRPVALKRIEVANPALAPMAVKAIDLKASVLRFADGSSAAMKQLELLSHTQGLQIVSDAATGNLNVLHENALRENFVTLVDDMSALQELRSTDLSAARRSQLEALAKRYGLNPAAADFANVVQGLRSAGTSLDDQETVIYIGDDDVWVDPAVRERLEQARISFRQINETGLGAQGGAGSSQRIRIGRAAGAERLAGDGAFDDRWVPSRRVGSADIRSDAAVTPATPELPEESRPLPANVYSLLSVTKGAQAGDLVKRQAVVGSNATHTGTPDTASSFVFSTAQPVAVDVMVIGQ